MNHTHLHILWTSGDAITAEKMVFMYAINSLRRGWWERVSIIVWGAPAILAGENPDIQAKIREALDAGVHVTACKACADQLGVSAALEQLGIEVKFWGMPLTELIKGGEPLLTV